MPYTRKRAAKIVYEVHNSDLTRLDNVDEKALKRVEKYRQAIDILNRKI